MNAGLTAMTLFPKSLVQDASLVQSLHCPEFRKKMKKKDCLCRLSQTWVHRSLSTVQKCSNISKLSTRFQKQVASPLAVYLKLSRMLAGGDHLYRFPRWARKFQRRQPDTDSGLCVDVRLTGKATCRETLQIVRLHQPVLKKHGAKISKECLTYFTLWSLCFGPTWRFWSLGDTWFWLLLVDTNCANWKDLTAMIDAASEWMLAKVQMQWPNSWLVLAIDVDGCIVSTMVNRWQPAFGAGHKPHARVGWTLKHTTWHELPKKIPLAALMFLN